MNLNDLDLSKLSVKEISVLEKNAYGEELKHLSLLLMQDARAGVQKKAVSVMKKYDKYVQEQKRLDVIKMREDVLHQNGYTYIAGIDEVGRGPLFGPVVAAAVIMPEDSRIEFVNDSKQLSQKNVKSFMT